MINHSACEIQNDYMQGILYRAIINGTIQGNHSLADVGVYHY